MVLSLLSSSAAPLLFLLPAADVFVDGSAANCASGTGSSVSPVCSINAAIAIASPGDTIRISPGTYLEAISIPYDLDLIGSAGASGTTISGADNGFVDPTILIPAGVRVEITGLTITEGTAGGIHLSGTLELSESIITRNGGGISADPGSDVTVTNCEFTNNLKLFGNGAAIWTRSNSCVIRDSIFALNSADSGGAIFSSGVNSLTHTLNITRCSFRENSVDNILYPFLQPDGGAVFHQGGSLNISASTFERNTTIGGNGGGLYVTGTTFAIDNSTFHLNRAGGTYFYGIVGGRGGGIGTGNGVTGIVSHSTITENTASTGVGGGIAKSNSAGLSVRNTIIAANNPGQPRQATDDVSGALLSLGHNLIGVGGTGFAFGTLGDLIGTPQSPLAPRLGPLMKNGGPTETRDPLPGSPVLDAGDALVFAPVDQRGLPRPEGNGPDIGAVEYRDLGTDFCNGDGGDGMGCTTCPCNNDAPAGTLGGCLNSANTSGRLIRSGSSSISAADLRFEAIGMPSITSAILLSGAQLAPANPTNPCFGAGSGITSTTLDGLRCVVQGILRHGVRSANGSGEIGITTNGWGTPNGFFNFSAFTAGQTRHFQGIYRDDLSVGCQSGLNSTQASTVTFVP